MAYERRDIVGAVPQTTITDNPLAAGATTINIASAVGWPSATNGNFVVTINLGESDEEDVLIQSRSGTTLTVAASGRGYNGTTAQQHSLGATINHTIGKTDADEANYTVAETVGKVTTAGDLLVADGANSLTRLAAVATGNVLRSAGTGTAPAWGKVTEAHFGTGIVPLYAQAAAPSSPAQGWHHHDTDTDLLFFYTGGGAWVPHSGQLIAATVLGASATSISFSSIPGDFKRLLLIGRLRSDRAGSTVDSIKVEINGDTTATNYRCTTDQVSNVSTITNTNTAVCGDVPAATAAAGRYGALEMVFTDYTNATDKHEALVRSSWDSSGNAAFTDASWFAEGVTAAAITSIAVKPQLGTNFVVRSTLALIGLR